MFRQRCPVLANDRVAPGHHVIRLGSARIGRTARPGQFVQILCSDSTDPLLPRPFSFLTATEKDFSVLYRVVGQGTQMLAGQRKGSGLWVLGPLGNGFSLRHSERSEESRSFAAKAAQDDSYLLVGGGVGIPPLYHLAQTFKDKKNIHVFLGARNRSLLLCEKEFKKLGVNLHLATDDGTKGHKGFVTDLVSHFLRPLTSSLSPLTCVYACGPTPMLKAVSRVCASARVPCEVSVEVPMACGFGACLGCAVRVRKGGTDQDHRFAIACKEGPVFDAEQIIW